MPTRSCLLLAALSGLLAAPLHAQVPAEKALATFTVADGLELSLWASEPLFLNPTCIDVDHLGRVWVCESVNYRSHLRRQPLRNPKGDRILILEDSTGSGKADRVTVFYQSPEILSPLGLAVARDPEGPGYRVFVCQSPDILVFEDRDGDGKADGKPARLLTGFRGVDHDHGVHGILLGPDGKLYFTVGDQGVQNLQSSDGKGKKFSTNNTDTQAGTVWRCNLDGTALELVGHNFRNNYEPCVDSFGTVFLSDNDDDGNQQTRICYVMPGGNHGYWPRGKGQTHWHEEQPGVVPKILRTYFGSPTGICVYEGQLLPERYRGQLLHTDAGPRHVRCYHLKPEGASYQVEQEVLVSSTDNWFRPSDVCVAPDGSVFFSDWYDPGVGGHGVRDFEGGRIYRLAPKGKKPSVPAVDLKSPAGIRAALASPSRAVRYMAIARLKDMADADKLPILRAALAQKEDPSLRARAAWQFAGVRGEKERQEMWNSLAGAEDERLRVQAVRLARDGVPGAPTLAGAVQLLVERKEPSAAVRRECLVSLRDVPVAEAIAPFYALAKQYDGKDRFYLCAVGIAVGQYDAARREAMLADFEKHFPEWDDRVADLVWELRPPKVVPYLARRLNDPALPASSRARIVDILAAAPEESAGLALLGILGMEVSPEVRAKVIENLKLFLPGKWQKLRQSKELAVAIDGLLARADTRATGLALLGAAGRVDAVPRVMAIIDDGKESTAVRGTAITTLGELPSDASARALTGFLDVEPAALRIKVVQALGAMIDQRGQNPPGMAAALKTLRELVRAPKNDLKLRLEAVGVLAGAREGGVVLLDLHAKGELPDDLKADTGRLLRNSPYLDLRRQAVTAFPPPGRIDPRKLPAIASLVTRKASPERGRQLMEASVKSDLQCLKCHTIRGQGGQIGPDLSMIGKKGSKENLFESILLPSKAVADQHVTWQIVTDKGLVLLGLIVEETPAAVTLRDANGKDTRLDPKEIDERIKSPKSLMPEDLLAYMTEEDLVDMVAYLATLQTPALTISEWRIAGPFDNGPDDRGLDQAFPPEKEIDLKATYPGKGGPVTWKTVRPSSTGYVDLQAHHGANSSAIVSYLLGEVESPADQEATVLLGTDDGARLWVNGEAVFTTRLHRAAAPEQDRVKVRLKKGTNRILLKINNGDGPHGFYFTLLTEQEVKQTARK